jgi:DNA polymerase-3 subunit delta
VIYNTRMPSQTRKPVVYVFHGDDEFAINQAVDSLISALGDSTTAELNTTRLEGTASESDIFNAAAAMPFLAERRLVIVGSPLARLGNKNAQTKFTAMLASLPPTAAVVLTITDQQKWRQGAWVWETLHEKHWLNVWCAENKLRGYIKAFGLPQTGAMPRWIQSKAEELGGKFENDAAEELVTLLENNTRVATQEIIKLLTYVNGERPVNAADVRALTAYKAEADVFELVDAMGARSRQNSLHVLHRLLEEEDEQAIFPMVVRQFRLLVQTRDLLDAGQGVDQIQSALKTHSFVAKKLVEQARRFTLPQLKSLYRELVQIDIAAKRSETSLSLALDLFISQLA